MSISFQNFFPKVDICTWSLAALIAAGLGCPVAQAGTVYARAYTGQASSDLMPVGGTVAAPTGFLEMCERTPSECRRDDRDDPERLRALARIDLAEKYRQALAALSPAPVHAADARDEDAAETTADSQPAQIAPETATPATTVRTAVESDGQPLSMNWTMAHITGPFMLAPVAYVLPRLADDDGDADFTDIEPGAIATTPAYLNWTHKADVQSQAYETGAYVPTPAWRAVPSFRSQGLPDQRPGHRPDMAGNDRSGDYIRLDDDASLMALLRSVNDKVNDAIRADTDADIYHVADYWAAPGLGRGARGDCEDFALQKRLELISRGVPAGALSIAIVRTRRGEDHAVLIVSTRDEDYVLDNLDFAVRPWRKVSYTWISRQSADDALGWVSLSPANAGLHVAYAR